MSEPGWLVAGRYRLVERIGRGGMGTVWRARDELLNREVAVKRLHHSSLDDDVDRLLERTRREARIAARLSHPNVVVVHDVVDDGGSPAIVMEYVPSVTLAEVIRKLGRVPPEEAARIASGVIAALRAAHDAGVVHRDIKPGNVLLGSDDRVVLTDFGIAVALDTSPLTLTGQLVGSIDYCSPERLTGGTPGPESDLWALGVLLYEAVEGEPPFRRETGIETAYAIVWTPVPSAPAAGPLAPLIEGLLVKDPRGRLTAEDVERMLRALQSPAVGAAVPARRPAAGPGASGPPAGKPLAGGRHRSAGAAEGLRPRNGKARGLAAAAALVAVMAYAVIAVDLRGGGETDRPTDHARTQTVPPVSPLSPSSSGTAASPTRRSPSPSSSAVGKGILQAPPTANTEHGPLWSDGSIDPGSNEYWAQSDVMIKATRTLTSLTVELRVAQTGGVSPTGSWRTMPEDDFTVTVAERDGFLVYRWTLKQGRTVPIAEHLFAAQYNHAAGDRDAGGDSYEAAATADGRRYSVHGTFAASTD
ncbi:serine/threonine-protein kinase [Streptomyces coeruleorubidus]|uniref:serine/threonine-protein kinase n=1 Tax=Streptomyces coeruleorubidus TaxID=116188 RepID=UPI0036FE44D1